MNIWVITAKAIAIAKQAVAKARQAGQVKFRIFLWLVLAGVIGWLLYMGIVPSGKISYTYDFEKQSKFIGKLTPKDRVEEISQGKQKIIGDPVYFSLRLPRRFAKAGLILKYKSSGDLLIIEAGILVDKIIWRYKLQPIENKIIDKLALVWNVLEEDGVMLLQPEKKYNSIKDFLNNLPDLEEIALYNYDLKKDYLIKDYVASNEKQEINLALRGSYQFYTYVKGEDLDFSFTLLDLNRNKNSDPININLYYNDKLIDSRRLDDDGITTDSGEITKIKKIDFKLANLPEGVYKIEVWGSDDIITKKIVTGQTKISFLNKIWLADSGHKEFSVYTDSRLIKAQTINPGSLQTLRIGDEQLIIKETYRQFSKKIKGDIKEIKIAKDDLILAGDGVFSFNPASLINPQFRKVDANLDINGGNINYILASYQLAQVNDGWKTVRVEFDLAKAYWEGDKPSFIISIPGLKADDKIDDWIEIGEIKIELEGKTLVEKLKEMFKK